MSGSDIVRAYRTRFANDPRALRKPLWRKRIMAGSIAASVVAMGSIIVQANDSANIYEVAKQYNRAASRAVNIPRIFQPQAYRPVQTSLSYAPVFGSLMPVAATGKRDIDSNRRSLTRSAKIAPKPARAMDDGEFSESYLSSRTAFCVRSCDGFFFPVGHPDGGDLSAHEAACQRACPDAETAVYVAASGSAGISEAITRKGLRYEALSTAYNYRTQYDSACTCNSGKRNYSVMTDFTLRKGDLVMSGEGLKEFRGGDSFPHRKGDFARADIGKYSARERESLRKMESSSLRSGNGSQLSPSLKAQITAQVNAARPQAGPGVNKLSTAAVARKIQVQDGREMRYVGPDMDFDRAR